MKGRVRLMKTLWGVPEIADKANWASVLKRVRADGFDGIECLHGPPGTFLAFPFASDVAEFKALMKANDLQLAVLVPTMGYPVPPSGVDAHIESFRSLVSKAVEELQPAHINCHSGKDSFSHDDAVKFFQAAVDIEASLGSDAAPVSHETHRQRILHSPFVYRDLMPHLPPNLKITADLSHWAVVCERCMSTEHDAEFWPPVLEDVAKRTAHIHARVGWGASAQVHDPTAPEHAADVAAHFEWWDAIVESMRARGRCVSVVPEFGPYPYLPHLPHTNVPVADLWQVCTQFGRRFRERYDDNV